MEHITHVKYILPVEWLISCLLDYNKFGHHNKLRLDPRHIPNLKWDSKAHKKTWPQTCEDINTIYVKIVAEMWCNKRLLCDNYN